MVLGRQSIRKDRSQIESDEWNPLDGTTMLPTFMPVATQAAIKGLTPQQVEQLGTSETWLYICLLIVYRHFSYS
jgi:hypothetical protein